MPPPNRSETDPRPRAGGWRVPNSSVFVPRTAAAGSTVTARAPIGSAVEFMRQNIAVGTDGAFSLSIPANAEGQLPVRIVRPDGQTPITLKIQVKAP